MGTSISNTLVFSPKWKGTLEVSHIPIASRVLSGSPGAEELSRRLRQTEPAVIGRIVDGLSQLGI